jgi:hypothetical protein
MNLNNQQTIRGAIIAVIVAAGISILTLLAGESLGNFGGKIFLICFSFIFFGITAAISLIIGSNSMYKNLGNAGAIVSGLGFLFVAILVLGEMSDTAMVQLTATTFIASIALAHISLLHHFKMQNKYAIQARIMATIFISLFSLILIAKIFEPLEGIQYILYNQSMAKIVISALVADLAATLLVPLCNRLEVKDETTELSFSNETEPPAKENEPININTEQTEKPL